MTADLDAVLQSLAARRPAPLARLFADEPDRVARMAVSVGPLRFDFSKQGVDAATLGDLLQLAYAAQLPDWRDRLFAGEVVNPSENRAATHWAERRPGADAGVRSLVERVAGRDFGKIRHLLHIGIGGSALGPALLLDALRGDESAYETAVVSNVDGQALADAFARLKARKTLLVVVSKTFTTQETMLNARTALDWLASRGVKHPLARVVAVTAAPEAALAFGVPEANILPFAETVGGRYSLWSAVGVTAALALGLDRWDALRAGAAAMDAHFREAPPEANAPVLAALIDVWNAVLCDRATRAVFPYDERLRLLVPYLQQLEMESNGKGVDRDGVALRRRAAPVTWGGTGTDAQHAVFQLLHQGVDVIPAEFIGVREPGHRLPPAHHRALLLNMAAQPAALMAGRSTEAAGGDPARAFSGDRPSTSILIDRLDAFGLGALLAFYEHRTFAAGVLAGVNPFDQWGVELGKAIARSLEDGAGETDPSTAALLAQAGLHPRAG